MNQLLKKMLAASSIKETTVLSDSIFFDEKERDAVSTRLPVLNIAFSGSLTGGIQPGVTIFAGQSKSYKSLLGLYCMRAYLDKYSDAVALFYDSEFGITKEYLEIQGIDSSRVIHIPTMNIEELKFDLVKKLKEIQRGEHVFIFVDSLGTLPSIKEIEDAITEKSVVDMTRAKAIRSLIRIITPQLSFKFLPCIIINHTYKTLELYSKDVIGGGTSVMFAANQAFIITRSQEKPAGGDLEGWNFTINVEKSRTVREKSQLTFQVLFDSGLNPWSGLLDLALESGHIEKPSKGWYCLKGETNKMRASQLDEPIWNSILEDVDFHDFVKRKYSLGMTFDIDSVETISDNILNEEE